MTVNTIVGDSFTVAFIGFAWAGLAMPQAGIKWLHRRRRLLTLLFSLLLFDEIDYLMLLFDCVATAGLGERGDLESRSTQGC